MLIKSMENNVVLTLAIVSVVVAAIAITVPTITGAQILATKEQPAVKEVSPVVAVKGQCVCSYVNIPPQVCELNPYCTFGATKGQWKEMVGKISEQVKAGNEKEVMEKGWKYGACNCNSPIYTDAGKDVCQMTPGCYFVSGSTPAKAQPVEKLSTPTKGEVSVT